MSNDNDTAQRWTRTNRDSWNSRTAEHLASSFYDVPAFLRGGDTLKPLETDLCGDVHGRDLLHLQCHFGLDTLSWARRGAQATGVDFSTSAIAAARAIAAQASLQARFHVADVMDLPTRLHCGFDLVVSTYGVLCWLPSLPEWARNVARCLRTGGRLVLVEFHPILDVFGSGCISGSSDYFEATPILSRTRGSYAARECPLELTDIRWAHSLGAIIDAISRAGMTIRQVAEHPFCVYPIVPWLEIERDGYWWPAERAGRPPCMFSIVAEAS